jgi:teichuronic acid biosynthesis protein TuaF
MKETLERIWARFKKLSIFLILIPFLAAGAAYLFQKGGPDSYTADAEIQLANVDKQTSLPDFTDTEYAKIYITNNNFLKNITEKISDIDKSKITFVIKPAKVINISYTGNEPEETEEALELIVDQYINDANEAISTINGTLEEAKTKVGSESEDTASDYELRILDLKEAQVLTEVQLDQVQENEKNTIVFGFLIGLILSFMILLLPEVFRK